MNNISFDHETKTPLHQATSADTLRNREEGRRLNFESPLQSPNVRSKQFSSSSSKKTNNFLPSEHAIMTINACHWLGMIELLKCASVLEKEEDYDPCGEDCTDSIRVCSEIHRKGEFHYVWVKCDGRDEHTFMFSNGMGEHHQSGHLLHNVKFVVSMLLAGVSHLRNKLASLALGRTGHLTLSTWQKLENLFWGAVEKVAKRTMHKRLLEVLKRAISCAQLILVGRNGVGLLRTPGLPS